MRVSLGKHPGVIVVGAVVVALVVWGFWPQPVAVEVVEALRAPLAVTIEEEGRTRVRDRYVVYAPVDGVACRIELDVGDRVEQGQTLLTISPLASQVLDPRSRAAAEARLAAARAALESARQQAESARASRAFQENEVQRLRPLLERGVVSRGEFDRAQTALRVAEAALRSAGHGVEVARYEQEAAETALRYTTGGNEAPTEVVPIRAPITGRVLKVPHRCAGPVRTGDPLLELGDPRLLEVEVDVLSADAVRIKPGMTVLLDRWGGAAPLQGAVRLVEPVGFTNVSALGVEEQRVLVIVDITSPPQVWQPHLGDGYSVEARFILWREDTVLQVPAGSLFRQGEGWALFAVEQGRAVRRPVTLGQRNGLVAQITAGVAEGERVINHPSDAVEDGRRVVAR